MIIGGGQSTWQVQGQGRSSQGQLVYEVKEGEGSVGGHQFVK